jgi:cellobiose phosphorylase
MYAFNSKQELKKFTLKNKAGLVFEFLENGSVFSLTHGDILINQILNNPAEGAMNNIYIRVFEAGKISYFPLLGPASESEFIPGVEVLVWKGKALEVEYTCRLQLDAKASVWFWTVDLHNRSNRARKVDVVFTQDIAIAQLNGVRLNEAYTSQYIDHTVLKDKKAGYLVCSRQNQIQGKAFPWLMHGCLNGAQGFFDGRLSVFRPGLQADQPTRVPHASEVSQ